MSNGNNEELLEYEDELLAALQEARELNVGDLQNEPFTVTRPEAEEIFDLSRRKTKVILDSMCESNMLKRAKVGRINNWGDLSHVPGYKYMKVK
jgi:hypothetical protein